VEGDDHGEAYTAILRGVGLSHERNNVAGAEALVDVEGNMCGTATRGSAALPGSEATSRKNGPRRNLGDLTFTRSHLGGCGPRREVEETKPSRKR
jgi:hypothetical protein